ncbi:MAG TPA: ABC transporter permease [Acidobacteria bacterium]|nr:ABC transporter permease [Acidobacteriota bacterium]
MNTAGVRRRQWNWTPWLIVAPALAVFVVFFAVPLLIMLANSIQKMDPATYQTVDRFTLYQYGRFLFDEYYVGVLLRTLRIGALTTLACMVAAYPVAIYMTKAGVRERNLLTLIIISPLLVSVVVLCFGWMIIVAPTGLVNFVLMKIGIIDTPLQLKYSEASVIAGLAHVYFPFMALGVYNSIQNIDPELVRAARILGAGPMRIFWHITFPLSMPGALAGSLIVFALSVSSFVTPMFLGGAWVKVVAYFIWEQNMILIDWPFGAAIAVILLLVTGLIVLGYSRLLERHLFAGVFHR